MYTGAYWGVLGCTGAYCGVLEHQVAPSSYCGVLELQVATPARSMKPSILGREVHRSSYWGVLGFEVATGCYGADPLSRCLRAVRPKSFGRARWAGGYADDLKEGIKKGSQRSL